MPYNEDFEAEPEDFLNRFAIIPTAGKILDGAGKKIVTGYFNLVPSGFQAGGNAEAVLKLEKADDGIKAYWLAYEDDKSKRAVLGNDARFMFTANMDGCSFGYGSKTGTGEVLVGHANAGEVGVQAEAAASDAGVDPGNVLLMARNAQKDAQAGMLGKKMTPGSLKILHPFHYADSAHGTDGAIDREGRIYKYAATVVGIRKPDGWKFFCQRRTITTRGQFVLRDVIEI